jgi:hypothetical protein
MLTGGTLWMVLSWLMPISRLRNARRHYEAAILRA